MSRPTPTLAPISTSPRPRVEIARGPNSKKIKIIVVSDLVCVWCYIAFKELNQAIHDLKLAYPPSSSSSKPSMPEIDIEYRPFFINTTAGSQDEAIDRVEYFQARYGRERVSELQETAQKRGKELGMKLHFNAKMRQTMRVHRLLYLAYIRGGSQMQQRLLSLLFTDFFSQPDPWTVDPTSVPQLATYAVQIGLIPDRNAAEKWLLSRAGEDDVMRLAKISTDCGISGVPFTVVEGKWAIGGGMERGIYYKTLEKLVLAQTDDMAAHGVGMVDPKAECCAQKELEYNSRQSSRQSSRRGSPTPSDYSSSSS